MAYVLYTLIFLTLLFGTVLYATRAYWLPAASDGVSALRGLLARQPWYARLPSTFEGDMEAGLTSGTFDLTANVDAGDGRAGLDDAAKAEILRIMKRRRLRFDEARRVYMERRFAENGIGADGRPSDPKLVTFS